MPVGIDSWRVFFVQPQCYVSRVELGYRVNHGFDCSRDRTCVAAEQSVTTVGSCEYPGWPMGSKTLCYRITTQSAPENVARVLMPRLYCQLWNAEPVGEVGSRRIARAFPPRGPASLEVQAGGFDASRIQG